LQVLNRISDRTRQELFVQDVAGRAGISEAALWPRVNKATTPRQAGPSSSQLPALGQVTKAEKALVWWLVHRPEETRAALAQLETADLEGLATGSVLDLARQLNDDKGLSLSMLLERLNTVEAQLVTGIASEAESPVHEVDGCVFDIKRLRCEREYAALQRELDRAQREGDEERVNELLGEKSTLLQRIAVLKFSKA
jgi:hypothetical protein